ncbi:hypothetical protein AVEN_128319-1 [Araneus ventricosus]|uniref:Uncharacterized protein n=1 Tax=Araneus ventricosus TaxID=182803 RepID=A0A4Y2JN03_ARAVE|nr:hypothetical protein AVEN_128319-1 [Araneus ventricosus]
MKRKKLYALIGDSIDEAYIQAPLKLGVSGRKQHELDSPTLGGHLPHHLTLCYSFPEDTRKWTAVGEDNWASYHAYLLRGLRTSPPLKRRQPPQTGLRRC